MEKQIKNFLRTNNDTKYYHMIHYKTNIDTFW